MVATLRVLAVFAVAACDVHVNVPRDKTELYVESKLESMWGITAPVHCHPMIRSPMPGDTFTCDMPHGGETYLIRVRIDDANQAFISVRGLRNGPATAVAAGVHIGFAPRVRERTARASHRPQTRLLQDHRK